MDLVEVVKGPHTSDETAEKSMAFIKSIGKILPTIKKRDFWVCCQSDFGKVNG